MSDFCNQCAIEHDFTPGDLADITKPADEAIELFCVVLCEGCGVTQVDAKGACIGGCWNERHGET